MILVALPLWAADGAKTDKVPSSAIPVTTSPVERRDVPVYVSGLGVAQASNTVIVKPQAEGQLIKIGFTEGQEVKAGDVLAQIDPRPYQAALDQAIAKKEQDLGRLAHARLDFNRFKTLVEQDSIAVQNLDSARALVHQLESAVKADEADVQSARINLGYTTIRSPIDGRTGIRQIDVGNVVHGSGIESSSSGGSSSSQSSSHFMPSGSDAIVVVTQTKPISVFFTLPQDQLAKLPPDAFVSHPKVEVRDRSGAQVLEEGKLQVVDNQIDPTTGTVRLKALAPNLNGRLWPGQYISAKLLVDTRKQALTVPSNALQKGDKGDFVYVVGADETVEPRPVQVGAVNPEISEIRQGLSEGEVVVIAGQFRLKPGAKVAQSTAQLPKEGK